MQCNIWCHLASLSFALIRKKPHINWSFCAKVLQDISLPTIIMLDTCIQTNFTGLKAINFHLYCILSSFSRPSMSFISYKKQATSIFFCLLVSLLLVYLNLLRIFHISLTSLLPFHIYEINTKMLDSRTTFCAIFMALKLSFN